LVIDEAASREVRVSASDSGELEAATPIVSVEGRAFDGIAATAARDETRLLGPCRPILNRYCSKFVRSP
jgi:hypothetical protein